MGDVADIVTDDSGEWLWAQENGKTARTSARRYSKRVRPFRRSPVDKTKYVAKKIAQGKELFQRRPSISRQLQPSTFTYPASGSAQKKAPKNRY